MSVHVRAMLVEDEPVTSMLLCEVMRQRGYEVETFGDGESAIEGHREQPFSLMVLDWMLPRMDGLELCRRVRASDNGESVAVLMITARTSPQDVEEVLRAGVDDYLPKPVDLGQLVTRLTIAEHRLEERTRRRHAEAELNVSERRASALIDAIPDLMLRIGVDGKLRDVHSPGAGLALSVVRPTTGQALADVVPPELCHRVMALLAESLQYGARSADLQVPHRGGVRHVEARFVPCAADEVLGIFRDVTERKTMEARLLLADRLVSVGTLSAGIAHEINNPLAYILANLDFLGEEMRRLSSRLTPGTLDEVLQVIGECREGSERVRQIVRDLRSFSRPDDGGVSDVDIRSVLDLSVNMVANEVRHRARLVKRYGDTAMVRANESHLHQVFTNLLVNAAQAIPEGAAADNSIELTSYGEEGRVVVEVSDTGAGIPPDVIGHIFDPFFTTKDAGTGTGLGLSICHSVVTKLGGEISVDSVVGRGTTFRVVLPTAGAPPVLSIEAARSRILIIDDDPTLASSLRRVLKEHEVVVTHSGREAIERCRQETFAVVLCDVMMPDLTGVDVYEILRRELPGMERRIIFISGGTFTPRTREFLDQVPNARIDKPFDVAAVRQIVREHLARASAG
jgi:two-component system, cell cycle sensor histidine kinase and response regulator CckA